MATVESKYSYEFNSGVKIDNVTFDQLIKFASSLGETIDASKLIGDIPAGYHLSESKGLVKIDSMDTQYIVNTICKLSRLYIEKIRPTHVTDLNKFLTDFVGLGDNPKINELFTELVTRSKIHSSSTKSVLPIK